MFMLLILGGCATSALMPSSDERSVDETGWQNYAQAEEFFGKIEVGKTTTEDLAANGLDLKKSKIVLILDRTSLMALFLANVPGSFDYMDDAVKQCLRAGKECVPILVRKDETREEGTGSFFLCFLGFKKESIVYGWNVEMLLLVHSGVIVYKQIKGTPNGTERTKKEFKPLGPLEGRGGSLLQL